MMRSCLLSVALAIGLCDGAQARCEDYVPQAKPQNTASQDMGREFDRIIEDGWIEFALYEDYAPWSYEEAGQVKGVDVEIGRLIAADLGVEPRFRLVPAGENLDADLRNYVWKGGLIGGRVSDVMLHVPYDSAYTCRVEQVVFTGQYATDTLAIAYGLDDYPEKGPTPPVFRYDTVGVENDSISDFYLTSFAGSDKIRRYASTTVAMEALAAGEVMAVMGPRSQLDGGLTDRLAVHQPPFLGLARGSWTVGLAVNHQHRDLGYAVDDAIAAGLADGRIEQIFQDFGLTFLLPDR